MPHFHVRYQGAEAVFDLTGRLIEGELGPRAERLVAEWAEERAPELEAAWQRAITGQELPWILPLR